MANLKIKVGASNGVSACGANFSYAGGQAFPSTKEVFLGSGKGEVRFDFSAGNNPDKFIVTDLRTNSIIYDSGYLGSDNYQSSLSQFLVSKSLPNEIIQPDSFDVVRSFKFDKSIDEAYSIKVDVYSPLSGTQYKVSTSCPIDLTVPDKLYIYTGNKNNVNINKNAYSTYESNEYDTIRNIYIYSYTSKNQIKEITKTHNYIDFIALIFVPQNKIKLIKKIKLNNLINSAINTQTHNEYGLGGFNNYSDDTSDISNVGNLNFDVDLSNGLPLILKCKTGTYKAEKNPIKDNLPEKTANLILNKISILNSLNQEIEKFSFDWVAEELIDISVKETNIYDFFNCRINSLGWLNSVSGCRIYNQKQLINPFTFTVDPVIFKSGYAVEYLTLTIKYFNAKSRNFIKNQKVNAGFYEPISLNNTNRISISAEFTSDVNMVNNGSFTLSVKISNANVVQNLPKGYFEDNILTIWDGERNYYSQPVKITIN